MPTRSRLAAVPAVACRLLNFTAIIVEHRPDCSGRLLSFAARNLLEPSLVLTGDREQEVLMVSQVQSEKIGQMLKEGWTAVPHKSPQADRALGGSTLLARNGEYVWVGASGQPSPATAADVEKW